MKLRVLSCLASTLSAAVASGLLMIGALQVGGARAGAQNQAAQPEIPWSRRPLRPDEKQYLAAEWSRAKDAAAELAVLDLIGARGRISREDWLEYRRREITESRIVQVFDYLGVRPAEHDELVAAGVNLSRSGYDPGRSAASADVVVQGHVHGLQYVVEGPYHTWVDVRVEKVLKGRIRPQEYHQPDRIWVKYLYIGPQRAPDGQIVWAEGEPRYKAGESVLLFLSRHPGQLLYYYHTAAAGEAGNPRVVRAGWPRQAIVAELRRQDYFEEGGAYHVRGDRAWIKAGELLIKDPAGEAFRMSDAERIIRRVAEIQERHRPRQQ